MNKKLIIIGAGGHCRSCIDVVHAEGTWEILGIVGRDNESGKAISGVDVKWTDNDIESLCQKGADFLIAIGQIKTANPRIKIYKHIKEYGGNFPIIISPRAYVSSNALIGEGSIVMHDVLVNAGASVGSNCILNTKSLIEHDSSIGDHCHISTASIVNGNVHVGEKSFVGSNAVIRNSISLQPGSIVSANEYVSKDR
jgi:sugar O-acyltransferase (sialic acid O-acetyltransferase NeuD family)